MTIPICDKCEGRDFCVVRRESPETELASAYFGRTKAWFEKTLSGISEYRAMCKTCGEVYDYSINHSLPVMD